MASYRRDVPDDEVVSMITQAAREPARVRWRRRLTGGTDPHQPRIALWGLFGIGNLGNEASLSVAIEQIRTNYPTAEVVCVCRIPERVRTEHHVATHPIRIEATTPLIVRAPRPIRLLARIPIEFARAVSTMAFLRRVDIVVAPGTGVLDDFDVDPLDEPFDLWIWSTIARWTRTPFVFVSVGAGPIDGRLSRALMLSATKRAEISYRDEGSRHFMSSIGHDVTSETVTPDLVFSLRPAPDAERLDQRGARRRVGLGVMAYRGWRRGNEEAEAIQAEYRAKLVELCGWFLDRDWHVDLLTGEDSDRATADEVRAAVEASGRRSSGLLAAERIESFRELLDVVGNVDLVVATRYHNIVAGLVSEKPVISIEYAEKNRRAMERCGLGDFCHHVETFTVDAVTADVARALESFAERQPFLTARLAEKRQRLAQEWERVGRMIVGE